VQTVITIGGSVCFCGRAKDGQSETSIDCIAFGHYSTAHYVQSPITFEKWTQQLSRWTLSRGAYRVLPCGKTVWTRGAITYSTKYCALIYTVTASNLTDGSRWRPR
jgi:hypothetical protein